jgi:hypothetical protein
MRPSFRVLAAALFLLSGCEALDSASNPLIGRWSVQAPGGVFALGTYEFTRSRMRGMGLEQEVDYSVSGDVVRVMPKTFGPTLEARLVDRDTAELGSPLTGGLVTMRRVR